jgi:hypothetical protein
MIFIESMWPWRTSTLAILWAGLTAVLPAMEDRPEPVLARSEFPELAPVPEHLPLVIPVRVYNDDPAPFVIAEVQPGCSCTDATATPMTIPSGGATVVSATIDNHGRSGPRTMTMTLVNADPTKANHLVPVRWSVLGHVTVDRVDPTVASSVPRPQRRVDRDRTLFFRDLMDPGIRDRPVAARLGSDTPPPGGLKILGIEAATPWLTEVINQGDGSWRVAFSLPPGIDIPVPVGATEVTQVVNIRTNHPLKPDVSLRIMTLPADPVPEE